jgi:hypothetical protein
MEVGMDRLISVMNHGSGVLTGESKVFKHGIAQTLYVSIPAKVASDSKCPIKLGDVVKVTIEGDRMTLEPKRKTR